MRDFIGAVALGFCGFLPHLAGAASLRCPINETVVMSDGSRFEFQGADPHDAAVCLWKTVRADGAFQSRFLFAIQNENAGTVFDPGQMRVMLSTLFEPASEGIVSAVLNNGSFNSSIRTVMKLSRETVTVPAGTFDAIVVHVDGTGVFENEAHVSSTYYLDEATHAPLQVEENENGNRTKLVAVKVINR